MSVYKYLPFKEEWYLLSIIVLLLFVIPKTVYWTNIMSNMVFFFLSFHKLLKDWRIKHKQGRSNEIQLLYQHKQPEVRK